MSRGILFERAQRDLTYALFKAGKEGSIKAAMQALKKGLEDGADINGRTKDGRTLLQEACFNGHSGVARLLILRGANPRVKDQSGLTAVDYIMGMDCVYDREKVTETLVEKYPEYADRLPKVTGEETRADVAQPQGG